MRAFLVHDSNGKLVSASVVRAGEDVQGDFMPAVQAGHCLSELDISDLVESLRAEAKSEDDAIARALTRLSKKSS
jgi:hypothetical protein